MVGVQLWSAVPAGSVGYSDLFAAYTAFQTGRAAMEPKGYALSPKGTLTRTGTHN